ncbi:MAG: hypothetical protein CMQ43_01450 [Gammaproteobacteria bacterium]|nr:hypothetical protein [Gammaproteobacteria bacterium]
MSSTSSEPIQAAISPEEIVAELNAVDWSHLRGNFDSVAAILARVGQADCLDDLTGRLENGSHLLRCCEFFDWRAQARGRFWLLVLAMDPETRVRLRMHVYEDHRNLPHNHRYDFGVSVLTGTYEHILYDENLKPALIARFRAGDYYMFGCGGVHSIECEGLCVTLMARGPVVRDTAVNFSEGGIKIHYGVRSPCARNNSYQSVPIRREDVMILRSRFRDAGLI